LQLSYFATTFDLKNADELHKNGENENGQKMIRDGTQIDIRR